MCEVGLSPNEFWDLSWYEWGLYLLRHKKKSEKEFALHERSWEQTRIMWATLININSSKGKGVKPKDLIELSYDKKEPELPKFGDVVKRFKPKV